MNEKQEYIERHCKICNQSRLFVTSLSPKGDLICCTCRYSKSIVPFEMIINKSGYKIVSGEKKYE